MAVRATPTVTVICADCGTEYELSRRNELEHRKRGVPHRCHDCRFPAKPPDARLMDAMRAWWLANYTVEEFRSWPAI